MDTTPAVIETLVYVYREATATAAAAAADAAAIRQTLFALGVDVDALDAQDARRRAARNS